jgi:hypothetical protein
VVEWEVGELWLQLLDKALSNQQNKVKRTKVMSVFHGYAILVLYQKYGGNSSRNKGSTRNLCATVHGTTAPQVTYLGGVREYVCCCWWWWWW